MTTLEDSSILFTKLFELSSMSNFDCFELEGETTSMSSLLDLLTPLEGVNFDGLNRDSDNLGRALGLGGVTFCADSMFWEASLKGVMNDFDFSGFLSPSLGPRVFTTLVGLLLLIAVNKC